MLSKKLVYFLPLIAFNTMAFCDPETKIIKDYLHINHKFIFNDPHQRELLENIKNKYNFNKMEIIPSIITDKYQIDFLKSYSNGERQFYYNSIYEKEIYDQLMIKYEIYDCDLLQTTVMVDGDNVVIDDYSFTINQIENAMVGYRNTKLLDGLKQASREKIQLNKYQIDCLINYISGNDSVHPKDYFSSFMDFINYEWSNIILEQLFGINENYFI